MKLSDNFFTEFPHYEIMKYNYLRYKNKSKDNQKNNIGVKDFQNSLIIGNLNHQNKN